MKRKVFNLIAIIPLLASCNIFPVNSGSNTSIDISQTGSNSETSSLDSTDVSVVPQTKKPLDVYIIEMTAGTYGDAIFLQVVNNDTSSFDIVIDCGWKVDGTFVNSFLKTKMKDKIIDMFIATHPHGDHIDGFYNMIGNYFNIETILDWGTDDYYSYYKKRNELVNNGTKYIKYYEAINSSALSDKEYVLNNDSNFKLNLLDSGVWSADGSCSITDNPNAMSVPTLFTYHDFTFLSMGDGIGENETSIINKNNDILPSDGITLFKANHHASNSHNSNSQAFLNRINPKAIAISASRVAGEDAYQNANQGNPFDDTQNKTATSSQQLHPNYSTVARFLQLPHIVNTKNVYWNMYAGNMLFRSYGNDVAPVMIGEGPIIGYYNLESDTNKVTGENNKKYVDTIVYKNTH